MEALDGFQLITYSTVVFSFGTVRVIKSMLWAFEILSRA
jgi:hypothetical protein